MIPVLQPQEFLNKVGSFVFNGNTLGTFVLLVPRHEDFFPSYLKEGG